MAITIKNIFIALAMTLFINASFAQSIDQKPNNSTVRGDGEATQKDFTFNTGLGANNPKLFTSDGAQLGAFTQNFVMGRGSVEDITLTVDQGLGATNPFLRWDSMISQWTFSNDGINSLPLGSGSGGGGINSNNAFSSSDNANGESGIAAWSYSGGGVFASLTSDPLEGASTFTVTGGLTSEFIQGPFLNMNRSIFRARACEASIEYIGGVEGLNYRILDMGGNVVAERELPVHTISAPESLFFFCPSVSQIANNPNLAQLRVSIESPATSNLSFFAFDRNYLGTFRSLSETVLPDILTGVVQESGSLVLDDGGFIASISRSSFTYTVSYLSGVFTEAPDILSILIVETNNNGAISCRVIGTPDEFGFQYNCDNPGGFALAEIYNITVRKKGADARQRVQVFQSIPRIAENFNMFSVKRSTANVLTEESNGNWIQSCTGTGTITCQLTPGVFTQTPHCSTDRSDFIGSGTSQLNASTKDQVVLQIGNSTGGVANVNVTIFCKRANGDERLPVVQPIVVGQVTSPDSVSVNSNLEIAVCPVTFTTGAPPTTDRACSWISSITRNSNGVYQVNIDPEFSAFESVSCFAKLNANDAAFSGNLDVRLETAFVSNSTFVFYNVQVSTTTDVVTGRKGNLYCTFL